MTRIHKRPGLFLSLVAAVLFLALCAYAGAALYGRLWPGERTASVRPVRLCRTLALEGLALRREQIAVSPEAPALLAAAGCRLPAGGCYGVRPDGSLLRTRRPAFFFSETDGYEDLGPDALTDLTAEGLRALLDRPPRPAAQACGRLVAGEDWYFAALAETDAPPEAGQRCTLRFSDCGGDVPARLLRVRVSPSGGALLVFRLTVSDPALLSLRRCRAELALDPLEGLALPAAALWEEADRSYVTLLADSGPCPCPVRLLYRDETLAIAAPSREEPALGPGSRVLLPGPAGKPSEKEKGGMLS